QRLRNRGQAVDVGESRCLLELDGHDQRAEAYERQRVVERGGGGELLAVIDRLVADLRCRLGAGSEVGGQGRHSRGGRGRGREDRIVHVEGVGRAEAEIVLADREAQVFGRQLEVQRPDTEA